MLQCKHLNERLEFGMESVAILSYNFLNDAGSIIPCRTAIVDLGLNQVDPGLTPDGAKCGDGKMCVNQKCMAVESLRLGSNKCQSDCNGNGICNSNGHCHCKTGFAPPYCDYPGPGGSEDSGPASDPNARKDVIVAMYVIFLGIVPLIALLGLLSYYSRHNPILWWKKAPTTATSYVPYSASLGMNFANFKQSLVSCFACTSCSNSMSFGRSNSPKYSSPYHAKNPNPPSKPPPQIKKAGGLVSTTNQDVLNNFESCGSKVVNIPRNTYQVSVEDFVTTPSGDKIAIEYSMPVKKLSLKNKNKLKVKTNLQIENIYENSPATCESICSMDNDESFMSVKDLRKKFQK